MREISFEFAPVDEKKDRFSLISRNFPPGRPSSSERNIRFGLILEKQKKKKKHSDFRMETELISLHFFFFFHVAAVLQDVVSSSAFLLSAQPIGLAGVTHRYYGRPNSFF
jgi:hypothetical protein